MVQFEARWPPRQGTTRPVIDMMPDGTFAAPPRAPRLLPQIIVAAAVIAILAGAVALAALAFWLAMTLLPIALGAGAIAYVAVRLQAWRARRGSLGGSRDLFRP